jgi:pyocin large subunit-like protein
LVAESTQAAPFRSTIGFKTRARLTEHYRKHGREFGRVSQADYLYLAQKLRDGPVGGSVLETVRSDGVVTRFDRATGSFLAFDPDGTIRTFFKPNDGETYFRRQARRRPNP